MFSLVQPGDSCAHFGLFVWVLPPFPPAPTPSYHPPAYGKDVPALIEQPLQESRMHIGKNTVTYEARLLKALFYDIIGWNK